MPDVFVYEDSIVVYQSELNVLLNTAPNLTEIDQEVQVTQVTSTITITQ